MRLASNYEIKLQEYEMGQITEDMAKIIRKLPKQAQIDIMDFNEANHSHNIYEPKDIVRAWLVWNGIVGYEDSIVDIVLGAYSVDRK